MLTPPPNFGRLKTAGTVAFRQARKHARDAMRRSRFLEEQTAYALRLAESGTPVVDVCRQVGVSEATWSTWKKKFGDVSVTELKRLKTLKDENARLKRIVADLTLDKQILQDVVRKNLRRRPSGANCEPGCCSATR